jgi:6-phosphogluconate dehydrogenase
MSTNNFGIIGLGKMGGNLALQAVERGYEIVGHSRHFKEHLHRQHLIQVNNLTDLVSKLPKPRIILMFVPAGKTVDEIIDEIVPLLSRGDVLADCGNSYWGDSIRRYQHINETGIHFVDCGTSGGIEGARHGACFMIGGDVEAAQIIQPVLKDLAEEGGYVYAGKPGAGHFVKLVHNGIEFGMLQSIGEGMALLAKYHDQLDIAAILECWENGSVIRSWLVELMRRQLQEQNGLNNIPSYIEDTGEVNWLINDALKMDVAIPVIAQSVMQLISSRDKENIGAKSISMMRHGFGGHPFGEDDSIKQERMFGQVSGFLKPKDKSAEERF